MNIAGLVGALLPVFFVLALGYAAGKRHTFDAIQAAGFSKLALGFALPVALFVSMTDIRKDLLLQRGRLVFALLLAHIGLFLVAMFVLQRIESRKGAGAIICALILSGSATPVFGIAVLQPLLGDTSTGTIGLVALAMNLMMPVAIIFLEVTGAKVSAASPGTSSQSSPVLGG
jgi:malonate transporter